jgi:hypothetical protein
VPPSPSLLVIRLSNHLFIVLRYKNDFDVAKLQKKISEFFGVEAGAGAGAGKKNFRSRLFRLHSSLNMGEEIFKHLVFLKVKQCLL